MLFTRRLRLFRKNKPFEKKLYLFHYWRYTYKMNSFRLEKCIPEIWRTLWDNECHWMHCLWSFASIVFIENAFFNIKLKATLKISRYFRENKSEVHGCNVTKINSNTTLCLEMWKKYKAVISVYIENTFT